MKKMFVMLVLAGLTSLSYAGDLVIKNGNVYKNYVIMGAAPNGHNSPLHKSARFTHRSWDESIDAHVKAGVPKSRSSRRSAP